MDKTSVIISKLKENGTCLYDDISKLDDTSSILSISSTALKTIKRDINNVSNNVSSIEEAIRFLNPNSTTVLEPSLSIERVNDIYIFKLSDRLPHKINYDSSTKSEKYSYDRANLQAGYIKGLNDFLNKEEISFVQDKLYLYFMTHFSKSDSLIDLDNLDVKVFIDSCVRGVFKLDDSPEEVFYTTNGFLDDDIGSSFTEVFIGSFFNVESYVLNLFKGYFWERKV